MAAALTVVKVGGSLYTISDLSNRLRFWLCEQQAERILLVPGGGATADVIRDFDRTHGLGADKAHWLALRALSLNAAFLAALVGRASIVDHPDNAGTGVSILDAFSFSLADEQSDPANCLPHTWTSTSDSIAARVAVVGRAVRLILLKSVTFPAGMHWSEATRHGFVDPLFCDVIRSAPSLEVKAVNFRELPTRSG
jgi:5-(aminomethyl)-3-furanmethanol phosphate kinase